MLTQHACGSPPAAQSLVRTSEERPLGAGCVHSGTGWCHRDAQCRRPSPQTPAVLQHSAPSTAPATSDSIASNSLILLPETGVSREHSSYWWSIHTIKSKLISAYKLIISVLRNYNFRFQEKNLNLDQDLNLQEVQGLNPGPGLNFSLEIKN